MKSLASWLSLMFLGMFWMLRIAVALASQYGNDFGGFIVFDKIPEIVLIFVSLVCFGLIVKRNILGPAIYLIGYGWYFGSYLLNSFVPMLGSSEPIDTIVLQNSIVIILQLVLGLVSLIDILYEKTKAKHFTDKKTDWYYGTDKYDRQMDERADKNQYRTL